MGGAASIFKSNQRVVDDSDDEEDYTVGTIIAIKSSPERAKRRLQILGKFASPTRLIFEARSKINVFAKLKNISTTGPFLIVTYSRWLDDPTWMYLGTMQSEPLGKFDTPEYVDFPRPCPVEFIAHRGRLLRFELFKINSPDKLDDLSAQAFLGLVSTTLTELLAATRRISTGWHVNELSGVSLNFCNGMAKLGLLAEEDSSMKRGVSFDIKGQGIPATDLWKRRPDCYCIFRRKDLRVRCCGYESVLRTEVVQKNEDPAWTIFPIPVTTFWFPSFDADCSLVIKDWYRFKKGKTVGETWLNYDELTDASNNNRPLVLGIYERPPGGDHIGAGSCKKVKTAKGWVAFDPQSNRTRNELATISLEKIELSRIWTFLDYIRGGLELKFVIGIDFSRSGTIRELHKREAKMPVSQTYMTILEGIYQVAQQYNPDNQYSMYGIGARIPPSYLHRCDCFSLTGNFFKPQVEGLEGICHHYQRALDITKLHGPTKLSPLVDYVVNIAKVYKCNSRADLADMDMAFYVLMLITDGDLDDYDQFLSALVEASDAPIYICILGVGVESRLLKYWHNLRNEVSKLRLQQPNATAATTQLRCSVTFIDCGKLWKERSPYDCATEALRDLPLEVQGYYKGAGVPPRKVSQYELPNGDNRPRSKHFVDKDKKKRELQSVGDLKDTRERHYFRTRYDNLLTHAMKLGYSNVEIEPVLYGYCASDSLEVLFETVSLAQPNYKEMLSSGPETFSHDNNVGGSINFGSAMLLIQRVIELFGCEFACLGIYSKVTHSIIMFDGTSPVPIIVPVGQGLLGCCYEEGNVINVPCCTQDYRYDSMDDKRVGRTTHNALLAPILNSRNQALGVIQACNILPSGEVFDKLHELRLVEFASGLGKAIEAGELDADMINQAFTAAVGIHRKVALQVVEPQMLRNLAAELANLLKCDRFSFFTLDDTKSFLQVHAPGIPEDTCVPVSAGLVGYAFYDQGILNIPDVYSDDRFDKQMDKITGYTTVSMLSIALVGSNGKSFGVIMAINKRPPFFCRDTLDKGPLKQEQVPIPFTSRDEEVFLELAHLLTEQLEAGELQPQKLLDELRIFIFACRCKPRTVTRQWTTNTLRTANSIPDTNSMLRSAPLPLPGAPGDSVARGTPSAKQKKVSISMLKQ